MSPSVATAFLLGAGLGTRLRPLTNDCPKPLFPIFGKPLITFALDHLISVGIESFVINTHYFSDQFEEFFTDKNYRECKVSLIHEPEILETGGGIKNAQALIGDQPFIVYSGDILTDIDLKPLIARHFEDKNDVTLALRETGLSASIALKGNRVIDIGNRYGHVGAFDFANVSIWNPSVFSRIPEGQKISFVPVLKDWLGTGGKIGGVLLNENHWFNVGSRDQYLDVHRIIFEGKWKPHYLVEQNWPTPIAASAHVESTVNLSGFYSIGPHVEMGSGVVLRNTVIWENAKIAPQSCLENCVIKNFRFVQGNLRDVDL